MTRRRLARALSLGSLFALLQAGVAQGALTVTIASPAEGVTISRGATPTTTVTGAVSFDLPQPQDTTWFLHRDGCSNDSADNLHLGLVPGGDPDPCGLLVVTAGANDVAKASSRFPAADGMPFTLDASRQIRGNLAIESFLGAGGVGQVTVDFTLTAARGFAPVTLGTASVTYVLLPTEDVHDVAFTMTPAAGHDTLDLTGLALTVYIHGPNVLSGYVVYNGASYVTVPTYSASFDRRVQVSVDDPGFAGAVTTATLDADLTGFSAEVATPPAGAHTIYARALQGTRVSGTDAVNVTVTA